MKRLRLALAAFLTAVLMLLSLTSCFSGILKVRTTRPASTTAPPVTTDGAVKEALSLLSTLADGFSPARTVTAVRYTDERIGVPLTAETELTVTEELFTLAYAYDSLNPIGSSEMLSRESGALSGARAELSAALSELYLWGVNAEGILLLTLDFPEEAFQVVSLEGAVLFAEVKDEAIASVVGSGLGGACSLTVSLAFEENSISSLSLSYLLGEASVSVTMTFFEQ